MEVYNMLLSEQVLTVEDVAKFLHVPVSAVEAEIASGRLAALNIAGHVRVREYSLSQYLNVAQTRGESDWVAAQSGFTVNFHAAPDFDQRWPDASVEPYTNVVEGIASYGGVDYQIKVGFTQRTSAGCLRARSLVLVNRYPSVEFVAEGEKVKPDSKMASIIRDRSGRQLTVGAEVPPEYSGKTIGPYRSVVEGPGARNGAAVICESHDIKAMVEHAVIRYRYRDERK
jgi:hypothetical protein